MFRFFKGLSHTLGRIPSSLLAFSYLLAIPAFAGIYTAMPNSFFHATSQYESQLNTEEQEILSGLRQSIIDSFLAEYESDAPNIDGLIVYINRLQLSSLRYTDTENTEVQFNANFEFGGTNDIQGTEIYVPYNVSFDTKIKYAVELPGNPERKIYAFPEIDKSAFPYLVASNKLFVGERLLRDVPQLTLSEPLHDQITAYINANRGFPSSVSGSFGRMFYFSAVTITTLGYGDIVPITDTTRWFVACESILGILLVGLFLNSLSHEYADMKEPPRQGMQRGAEVAPD